MKKRDSEESLYSFVPTSNHIQYEFFFLYEHVHFGVHVGDIYLVLFVHVHSVDVVSVPFSVKFGILNALLIIYKY